MANEQDSTKYTNWLDAAKGGNLASYAYSQAPNMEDVVPGYSSSEPFYQKAIDYASLVPRVLAQPFVQGGEAMQQFMNAPPMAEPESARRNLTAAALGVGMLGAPVPKPAGALGMFGGNMATSWSRVAEEAAAKMEAAGASREEIYDQIGKLFRGEADKQWRFEIPDSNANLNVADAKALHTETQGKAPKALNQVLTHDELFQEYPEMKNLKVQTYEPSSPGDTGYFDPDRGTIFLSNKLNKGQTMQTLLHELQHAIQVKQNFATGASPTMFLPKDFAQRQAQVQKTYEGYKALLKDHGIDISTVAQYLDNPKTKNPVQQEAMRRTKEILQPEQLQQLQDTMELETRLFDQGQRAITAYRKVPGEKESINVERRFLGNLYQSYPWLTGMF